MGRLHRGAENSRACWWCRGAKTWREVINAVVAHAIDVIVVAVDVIVAVHTRI